MKGAVGVAPVAAIAARGCAVVALAALGGKTAGAQCHGIAAQHAIAGIERQQVTGFLDQVRSALTLSGRAAPASSLENGRGPAPNVATTQGRSSRDRAFPAQSTKAGAILGENRGKD
jgi:hypothetical protein